MITKEEVEKYLYYNPDTGKFYWRVDKGGNAKEGDEAGTIWHCTEKLSYVLIWIDGSQYRAHRLAFLVTEGRWPEYIDHINGIGIDNRWSNLREVSKQGNAQNQRLSKANTSGQTGVSFHYKHKLWIAYINVNYKRINLGWFNNYNDAVKARKEAELEHGFHENHGKEREVT